MSGSHGCRASQKTARPGAITVKANAVPLQLTWSLAPEPSQHARWSMHRKMHNVPSKSNKDVRKSRFDIRAELDSGCKQIAPTTSCRFWGQSRTRGSLIG
jgi:hypothetical protein